MGSCTYSWLRLLQLCKCKTPAWATPPDTNYQVHTRGSLSSCATAPPCHDACHQPGRQHRGTGESAAMGDRSIARGPTTTRRPDHAVPSVTGQHHHITLPCSESLQPCACMPPAQPTAVYKPGESVQPSESTQMARTSAAAREPVAGPGPGYLPWPPLPQICLHLSPEPIKRIKKKKKKNEEGMENACRTYGTPSKNIMYVSLGPQKLKKGRKRSKANLKK